MAPLAGTLVVDFSWYLPGPFATRELLRLGARDARLNAGNDPVEVDLKAEPGLGRALADTAPSPPPVPSLEEAAAGLAPEEPAGEPAPVARDSAAWRRERALE